MSRETRILAGTLLLVGLWLWVGAACVAQRLSSEPVNPDWVRYMNARRVHAVRTTTADGHALGYIPEPFRHLGAERIRPRRFRRLGLPTSYDLRTTPGKVPPIRDQGNCGSCWAFGSFASLETCLRPGDTFDGSENNLNNTHGFDPPPCEGGNSHMSAAYFARWNGPVSEAADPYNPGGTSPPNLPAEKHVQDVIRLPNRASYTDNDLAKQAIMDYGAVTCAFYYQDSSYNAATHAYYCNNQTGTNHLVAIIGWDDNFAASNFRVTPPGNGAFLMRNSWGTGWGEAGYYWQSYYDTSLGWFYVFDNAEPTTNYAAQYSYDPLVVRPSITLYYGAAWCMLSWQKGEDTHGSRTTESGGGVVGGGAGAADKLVSLALVAQGIGGSGADRAAVGGRRDESGDCRSAGAVGADRRQVAPPLPRTGSAGPAR
jgi:C1A family cysteine protease